MTESALSDVRLCASRWLERTVTAHFPRVSSAETATELSGQPTKGGSFKEMVAAAQLAFVNRPASPDGTCMRDQKQRRWLHG